MTGGAANRDPSHLSGGSTCWKAGRQAELPAPQRVLLICGALLLNGGCFLQKKPAVQAPVAVPPAPLSVPASAPPAAVPTRPAPAPSLPATAPAAPATESGKPSPFPPVSNSRPTPAPAPALGTILTADRRKQLETAYQSDLREGNAALSKLNGRPLTPEQNDSISRARAFIRQAAQYHDKDITTAAELAHRARVLAQDLAGALR